MKRNILTSAIMIILVSILLCSCDTSVLGNNTIPYNTVNINMFYRVDSTDGRYSASNSDIFDKTKNEFITLVYDNHHRQEYVYKIEFLNSNLIIYSYTRVPVYSEDTGKEISVKYLPSTFVFDMQGNQISCTCDEKNYLTKDEISELGYIGGTSWKTPMPCIEGIENLISFISTNSVYYDRYQSSYTELNELEAKIKNYIFDLEEVDPNQKRFYYFDIRARRIEDKIYISYDYCDKKNWKSQGPITSGYQSATLLTYDETDDKFETVYEAGERSSIFAFDNKKMIIYSEGELCSVDIETQSSSSLMTEFDNYTFSTSPDRLLVYEKISYYSDIYRIYDFEGNLLKENKTYG